MKLSSFATLCVLCLASTTTVSARPVLLDPAKYINKEDSEVDALPSLRIRNPYASASVAAPNFSSQEGVSDTQNNDESDSATAVAEGKVHVPEVLAPFLHRFDPAEEPLSTTEASFLEATITDAFYRIHQDRGMGKDLGGKPAANYDKGKDQGGRPLLRGSHRSPPIPIDTKVLETIKQHKNWISF